VSYRSGTYPMTSDNERARRACGSDLEDARLCLTAAETQAALAEDDAVREQICEALACVDEARLGLVS
jgi:hypothetical protein